MESANNPLVDAIAGALIQSKLEILTKKQILYKKALNIGKIQKYIFEN